MTGIYMFRAGAIAAFLGVAAGAFLAHGLGDLLNRSGNPTADAADDKLVPIPRRLEVFEIGVRYQMYHAFGLMILGLTAARGGSAGWPVAVAGWGFLAGIVLFSGSLYAMTFTGFKWLGAITPIGGVGFLVGWIALACASWPRAIPAP